VADTNAPTVGPGKVVTVHYTLTNARGDVLDTSSGHEPLDYLHGAGNIVRGLERAMADHAVGDRFDVVVAPKDGYGERTGPGPQAVPRSAFPKGAHIEVGTQFMAEEPGKDPVPLWVTKVEPNTIHVDQNHPLAGEELRFAIEVVSLRDATDDERTHGHPHGPHGHHH
jgi:FKBP-type peptidyl-prolyl cis-trans isomerase SlyD